LMASRPSRVSGNTAVFSNSEIATGMLQVRSVSYVFCGSHRCGLAYRLLSNRSVPLPLCPSPLPLLLRPPVRVHFPLACTPRAVYPVDSLVATAERLCRLHRRLARTSRCDLSRWCSRIETRVQAVFRSLKPCVTMKAGIGKLVG